MNILVINAGSSSLKYQLFNTSDSQVLAKGLCERIGIDGRIKHSGSKEYTADLALETHSDAIRAVLDALLSPEHGVISSMGEIEAVGHRIVHGGEHFTRSMLLTDDVIAGIEDCCALAPLHNPASLMGIRACLEVMPDVPQTVVFDTAFHQTMPPKAFLYPLPYSYYEQYKVRRYGFHGTSHRYVSAEAARLLGRPLEELKIITCHLGNGSSITAVDGGKSVDTSMGFTPLDGLPMGTRSGSIDPAILSYVMEREGLNANQMLDVLNKKSGVLGVSGVSSDFRDLDVAAEAGNERAKEALELFIYDVKKYIGAYAAAMGGVDAVVFTAGIGENNIALREQVMDHMDFLGLKLDPEKNNVRGKAVDVSAEGSRGHILVIPTNEELVIATDTEELVKNR